MIFFTWLEGLSLVKYDLLKFNNWMNIHPSECEGTTNLTMRTVKSLVTELPDRGQEKLFSCTKTDSENMVSWQEENNLRSRRGMATTMLDKISGIALDADRQQKNNKILDVKCVCVTRRQLWNNKMEKSTFFCPLLFRRVLEITILLI